MNKGLSKDRLKRVNWASDDLLCQVKLFLSEESPSQIGNDAEDHLQIKAALHSNGMSVDDLPPGFGGQGHAYTPNQICISQIKWTRPPMFKLDGEWHVVSGEESEERVTQNHREMRVLEALYPRVSAIPPSPSVSREVEACDFDDRQTPIIPLNSIEDEDSLPIESAPCSNSSSGVVSNVHIESKTATNEKLHGIVPGLDADVIAAASAAYAASLKNNEIGSMVDTDLLIRILNEPKMIEALTKGSVPLPFTDQHLPLRPVSDTSVASRPFHSPMTSQPYTKPCTVTSSDRSNENMKAFPTFPIPNSETSSNSPSPLQAILSKLGDSLKQGQENGGHPARLTDNESNLSRKMVPVSNSAIFGLNASSLDSTSTFSPKPDDMYTSHRSNVGPSARPENHSLTMGSHMFTGSSQLSAPQPDRFPVPSVRTPATKDLNYYKSLIRLHGAGGEETPQYQGSLTEATPVSVQGQRTSKLFRRVEVTLSGRGIELSTSGVAI
ncbi:hypothetical protein vseg_015551 [Gypsophila vaccaria]